jgi:hypothetical protein
MLLLCLLKQNAAHAHWRLLGVVGADLTGRRADRIYRGRPIPPLLLKSTRQALSASGRDKSTVSALLETTYPPPSVSYDPAAGNGKWVSSLLYRKPAPGSLLPTAAKQERHSNVQIEAISPCRRMRSGTITSRGLS